GCGSRSCQRCQELRVQRIELPARKPLRLRPQRAQVRDDRRAAFAVAQHVDAAAPVVQAQAEVVEHPVEQRDPQSAAATAASLLRPVLRQQHSTKPAHGLAFYHRKRGGVMAKEIFCSIGVDVDAVAGWLGSYGGENSPDDISRGMFAGEVGTRRLLKMFKKYDLRTTWFIPGHSIET